MKFNFLITLVACSVLHPAYCQKGNWKTFPTKESIIYDICFTNDGKMLIAADGSSIKIFSTATQTLQGEIATAHTDDILTIDLSSDDKLLATGGRDGNVMLWDFDNKQLIRTLKADVPVTALEISPDANKIAFRGRNNVVSIYDVKEENYTWNFTDHTSDVTAVDFARDGSVLATASADKTVKVYDLASGRLIHSLSGHNSWVRDISFSADGNHLYSCADDSKVLQWNSRDMSQISLIEKQRHGLSWLTAIECYNDNSTFAVANLGGKIEIIGTFGTYSNSVGVPVQSLVFMPHQTTYIRIAVATRGKGVLLINAEDM